MSDFEKDAFMFRNITNIDVSGVVIKRMQQKYGRNRPGLDYLQMDALQTDFPATSFSTIFDKGTLDALFTDDTDESKERIGRLFNVRIIYSHTWELNVVILIDICCVDLKTYASLPVQSLRFTHRMLQSKIQN